MTLEQASRKFDTSVDILEKYISLGLIKSCSTNDYKDEDFENLGLIYTLWNAEFTGEEIKKYLTLIACEGTDAEQVCMLRKHRRMLLDGIHEKQQILDNLDYIIRSKK